MVTIVEPRPEAFKRVALSQGMVIAAYTPCCAVKVRLSFLGTARWVRHCLAGCKRAWIITSDAHGLVWNRSEGPSIVQFNERRAASECLICRRRGSENRFGTASDELLFQHMADLHPEVRRG